MAEHTREKAGLKYVAIFRHAAGSHTVLEELARASMLGLDEMRNVRAAGHATVRGMRRFARRAVTLDSGIHVVAAEMDSGEVVSVVASGVAGARLREDMNRALVELARVAARVLSEHAAATPEPSSGVGYGTRFGDVLAFLQRPPILDESRSRLAHAVAQRPVALADAIETVETDVGLAIAVMTAANQVPASQPEGVATVPGAIVALSPGGLLRLAESLPTLSPAAPGDRVSIALSRISAHAIVARSAAEQVARLLCAPERDELRLAASLHDIGKVALVVLREGYLAELSDHSATPDERFAAEQKRLTIEHATIGALLLRRLGLPRSIATLVDHHHAGDAPAGAAIIRLADMLAHMSSGDPVNAATLASLGRSLSLREDALHGIVYDLQRTRGAPLAESPSPLTLMQEKALRGLAEGKRYKQIAADLGLAESTVRSHVHNLYRKLGVADRAHAVLLASERGWL
jgi:putative nucleotidyltransferase with HDIG domain